MSSRLKVPFRAMSIIHSGARDNLTEHVNVSQLYLRLAGGGRGAGSRGWSTG